MKKGFTLVELIITIALFSMLTGVVVWVFVVGLRVWGSGMDRANLRQNANLAIERMVRELSLASEFKEAKLDKVKFKADLGGLVEEIEYKIKNNNLQRKVKGGTEVILVRNVQDFTLGYYLESDSDNENLLEEVGGGAKDDIRVVVISLSISEGDETITLSSSAYARNQGL